MTTTPSRGNIAQGWPLRARTVAAADPTAPPSWLGQLAGAALVIAVAGASLATAAWLAVYPDLEEFLQFNAMKREVRYELLGVMAGGGAIPLLIAAGYLVAHRSWAAVERVGRAARIVAPLMLTFALPILFNWQAFAEHQLLLAVVAAAFGVALERTLRTSLGAISWQQVDEIGAAFRLAWPRLSRVSPSVVAGALAISFAVYCSYYALLHHYRLQTHAYDLAIFDNMMWNLLRGEWFKAAPDLGPTGSHLQKHATFAAYLLLPFYALRQQADTLLIIQSTLCGLGAIPVYLLARRRFASPWAAVALVYAYVVYAPLHGAVFYDFHFLTLAPFFVGWVFYFFETQRRWWLLAAWLLAVLLREDISALLAAGAFFYLLCGDRPRWALAGALLSALAFGIIKFLVLPAHQPPGGSGASFSWMFGELMPAHEGGFGAVLRTLLSNPVFTLQTILVPEKLTYVLKLLAPLLLLPLRNSRAWLLVLVPAIFTLLSTGYKPVISTTFQYTSYWTAGVFIAAAVTMSSWLARPDGRVRLAAAAGALVLVSTVFSYHHGALFHRSSFRGGFGRVQFHLTDTDLQDHVDLYALIAKIPPKASVAATENVAPHVSAREDCFTLRVSHYDAEHLLVDLRAARQGKDKEHLDAALGTGLYGFVGSHGHFALWAKGHSKANDAAGARLLGHTPKDAEK